MLTEHWLSLLSLRVCVPQGATGTDSGPRGGGLCSRRGDKQLTPVVLGHLARGHHWGKDDLLTPESSWASPVVSLNRVTRAGDTEQKEPSLAGVRWPQGATCASCPPPWAWLGWGRSHRKEAWVLFPAIQGKTLCLGRASLLRPQVTGLSLAPSLDPRIH